MHAPSRAELDLSDKESVMRVMASRDWAAVINAAAYTAVDRAECDPNSCWTVNAVWPAVLAEYAAKASVPIVHLSTDYVFSGDKDAPYLETDAIGPLGVYGASKAAGELAIQASGARAVILRTSWVVSPFGQNFLKTMLRLASEGVEIKVVADQHGTPTSAADLARVIVRVLERMLKDLSLSSGVYHVASAGETTWFGLAEEIFMNTQLKCDRPKLRAILTKDYPTLARRPKNSRLATDKIKCDFDIALPDWRVAILQVLKDTIV